MRPHSILVHGDTPGAVALARAIRREIEAAGGRVVPVSRLHGLIGVCPIIHKTALSPQRQSILALGPRRFS